MSNTGCVIASGYCIHCRRPSYLHVSINHKCSGSTAIPVAQSAIERWSQEPMVQDVLDIMDCRPWESECWDGICEKCKRASGGLAAILDERDRIREGLKNALKLLERAECPSCRRLLMDHTSLDNRLCIEHIDVVDQITRLKKLLSSK